MKDSIVQCIGGTPTVRLGRLSRECRAVVAAKLEMLNPMSVKDRPVFSMIEDAERQGLIN